MLFIDYPAFRFVTAPCAATVSLNREIPRFLALAFADGRASDLAPQGRISGSRFTRSSDSALHGQMSLFNRAVFEIPDLLETFIAAVPDESAPAVLQALA
jgi:hypothetical protein